MSLKVKQADSEIDHIRDTLADVLGAVREKPGRM